MQSAWRGEKRMTSEPNREMSNRLAPAAINSMAQQARPIGIGQTEFLRNQFKRGVHAGDDDVAFDLRIVADFGFGSHKHNCARKAAQRQA